MAYTNAESSSRKKKYQPAISKSVAKTHTRDDSAKVLKVTNKARRAY